MHTDALEQFKLAQLTKDAQVETGSPEATSRQAQSEPTLHAIDRDRHAASCNYVCSEEPQAFAGSK